MLGEENNTDAGICHISLDYTYTVFSTFGAFWLPLTVIVVVYGRIFWIAQRRLHRRIRQRLTALPPLPIPISAPCSSPPAPSTRSRRRRPPAGQLPPEVHADDGSKVGGGGGGGTRSTPLALLSVTGLPTTAAATAAAACDDAAVAVTPSSTGATKPETEFLQVPATSRRHSSEVAAVSVGGGGLGSSQNSRSRLDVISNHLVSYRKCQYKRMRNSARMLGLIIGCFVLCWLPFFLLATAVPFCAAACSIPGPVASVCNWLGYSNSLLNPVIYAIWDRNFRRCFRRLARCDFGPSGIAASAAARGLPGAAIALRRSEPF